MARPARQSTAAYSASQALFDALRNGTSKIAEQEHLLSEARDLVQTLHVKLATANGESDAGKHQQYMDNVVKAWRSALSVYSAVFVELASITAPDASEGKAAREGHDDFTNIAESLEAARTVALKYTLSTYAHTARPAKQAKVEDADAEKSQSSDEATSTSEANDTTNTTTATDRKKLTLLGKRPPPANEIEVTPSRPAKAQRLSDRHVNNITVNGATASTTPVSSQKRQKRRAKAQGGASVGANGSTVTTGGSGTAVKDAGVVGQAVSGETAIPPPVEPAAAGKESGLPGLEYEDVSAEVQARLKAKEEKKKAKKGEKKRKRESGASLPDVSHVETVVQKPQKKKAKTQAAAAEGTTNEGTVERLEKRKTRLSVTEGPGEGRRKRVKSK